MKILVRGAILAAGLASGGLAQAVDPLVVATKEGEARHLFVARTTGSQQKPQAIGSYARGCLAGGVELAENGPTWQAMRLSRNRNWGHPVLIDFVKTLSQTAAKQEGWAGLYVGDMSQPRGGPMLTGHRSHQIGLDVDIWMLPPKVPKGVATD